MEITTNHIQSERHTTFYRSCGPADGPLLIMTHGWPELSLSWRHQLKYFGELGYLAVAPDMRGYGNSTVHTTHEAYTQAEIIADMVALFKSFGRDQAVWVGHDWGSPVAWNMALHHPDYVAAVASLCVPYGFSGRPEDLEHAIDRDLYPADEYPVGQWDYQLHYYENFAEAQAEMEESPYRLVKALFRKGDPNSKGQPAATASVRKNGGWFKLLGGIPALPIDEDVVSEEDAQIFAKHLEQNGFFGANSWYVNGEANQDYTDSVADKMLNMPVLFIHATYDYVCDTTTTQFAEPMRQLCPNLTEKRIDSGHWMAQEKPAEVNQAIHEWLNDIDLKI